MNLAAALDAREGRVSKSAESHLIVREHPPAGDWLGLHSVRARRSVTRRALVVYTRRGIIAFEVDWEDAPRCGRCFPA